MDTTAVSIAAWEQTIAAAIDLGAGMTDEQWHAQTECPEWTVKDVYAHLIGGELWMAAGHPAPAEGLGRIAGQPVDERREVAPAAILAELREVFERRKQQLDDDPPNPDEPATTAYGAPVTLGILLGHRAFDGWVHEQDIRRAIGVPGNLSTAGAQIAAMILSAGLPRVVAKLAGAPAGSSVRVSVTGPVAFEQLIVVDEHNRGQVRPGVPADGTETVVLEMDWETYSRLAAGRISPQQAAVTVTGDQELADRILARFAITP